MPDFTRPVHELREDNDCHLPAGSPEGGRFCSKGGPAEREHIAGLQRQWAEEDKVIGHIEPAWSPPRGAPRWRPGQPYGWLYWAGSWSKRSPPRSRRRKR